MISKLLNLLSSESESKERDSQGNGDGNKNCPIRLIVGLGNPGPKYSGTRHNLGFDLLDSLATQESLNFTMQRKWEGHYTEWEKYLLLKPMTYMNESGRSVARAAKFLKLKPSQILIIYDDISLPLGNLRIRQSGSAGGHNGMRSIIQTLGSEEFPRLRLGIKSSSLENQLSQGAQLSNLVLGKFTKEERTKLDPMLNEGIKALITALHHGVDQAMTQFN